MTLSHFQFRVRTLLFLFAMVGIGIFVWKSLTRGRQIYVSVNELVLVGPSAYWGEDPRSSTRRREYDLLRSDFDHVANRLIWIAQAHGAFARGSNAVHALRLLVAEGNKTESAIKYLPPLLSVACDPSTTPEGWSGVADVLHQWIPQVGLTDQQRKRLNWAADSFMQKSPGAWVRILDAMGGRTEITKILNTMEIDPSPSLLVSQIPYTLKETGAEELSRLNSWLREPKLASSALEFEVFTQTPQGRELLLRYIADADQSPTTRLTAIMRLSKNRDGIELLMAAIAEDSALADMLTSILNMDCRSYLRLELRNLQLHESEVK